LLIATSYGWLFIFINHISAAKLNDDGLKPDYRRDEGNPARPLLPSSEVLNQPSRIRYGSTSFWV
jgi:hypothetical protein